MDTVFCIGWTLIRQQVMSAKDSDKEKLFVQKFKIVFKSTFF